MPTRIVEVSLVGPHRMKLKFKDGSKGELDFLSSVGVASTMTRELADPEYFARVFLDHDALTWPNGFDLCPDWTRSIVEQSGNLAKDRKKSA